MLVGRDTLRCPPARRAPPPPLDSSTSVGSRARPGCGGPASPSGLDAPRRTRRRRRRAARPRRGPRPPTAPRAAAPRGGALHSPDGDAPFTSTRLHLECSELTGGGAGEG